MKMRKPKKYAVRIVLSALSLIAVMGCSGHKVLTKPTDPQKMLHFSELKNWDETKSLNNHVLYVDKGDSIPLAVSLTTDFLKFKQPQMELVAKKKLYFRIQMPDNLTKEEMARLNQITARGIAKMPAAEMKSFFDDYMLYLSTDARHWAPINSKNVIKEVLDFKMGTMSAGLKASTTDGLGASLSIQTVR